MSLFPISNNLTGFYETWYQQLHWTLQQSCTIHLNEIVALKKKTTASSEASVQTYPTRRKPPKDGHLTNTRLQKSRT